MGISGSLECSLHLSPVLTKGNRHGDFKLPNPSVTGLEERKFPDSARAILRWSWGKLQELVIGSKISKSWDPNNKRDRRRSGGSTSIIHHSKHWITLFRQLTCKILGHILEGHHRLLESVLTALRTSALPRFLLGQDIPLISTMPLPLPNSRHSFLRETSWNELPPL